jgi:hypothetical protein
MPFLRAEGLQAPELPPAISTQGSREDNLTLRKGQLEVYLSRMIQVLVDRMPLPLLMFLGFHE